MRIIKKTGKRKAMKWLLMQKSRSL